MGLQYATEQNEGRMYINLQGGPANMPAYPQPPHGGQQQHHEGQPQGGQQGYPGGQQQYGGGQQQHQQQQGYQNQDEVEKLVIKLLPRIIRKLEGCCVVM